MLNVKFEHSVTIDVFVTIPCLRLARSAEQREKLIWRRRSHYFGLRAHGAAPGSAHHNKSASAFLEPPKAPRVSCVCVCGRKTPASRQRRRHATQKVTPAARALLGRNTNRATTHDRRISAQKAAATAACAQCETIARRDFWPSINKYIKYKPTINQAVRARHLPPVMRLSLKDKKNTRKWCLLRAKPRIYTAMKLNHQCFPHPRPINEIRIEHIRFPMNALERRTLSDT